MTVCIAALYENGQGAVLVSDQMITAHIPIGYQYENSETTKIIAVDDAESVYSLVAGDVLRGNEIIERAKAELIQQEAPPSASGVAELVRVAYQRVRITGIVHRELEPRGLNLETFYGSHQQLAPQIVQMIDQAMSQTDMGVQILIAGSSGRLHTVHTIVNPGTTMDNTAIGHGAIGFGAPHALASLIEDSYNPSASKAEVVGMVERAKARSEIAPGVGRQTTTLVIPKEDKDNADG